MIIEDLEIDRESLAELIRQDSARTGERITLSFFESGEAFLSQYRPKACDGLFLDIQLGGVSGIEVAKTVRKAEPRLPIIFTTIEPDFALDGFSVHAMDFLVKPLVPEKVSWCLKELRSYPAEPAAVPLTVISSWGHAKNIDVPPDEILYGHYHNHVIDVHTTQGILSARLSFQAFTALLPQTGQFFICGRGLVVNLSQIKRAENKAALLNNGERLPVSRSRAEALRQAYWDWTFAQVRKGRWA